MALITRLEYKDIFDEPKEQIEYYLSKISRDMLLKMIPFLNNNENVPNFDQFFQNPQISRYIINKVLEHCKINGVPNKPVVISRLASLIIVERVLSAGYLLSENSDLVRNIDQDELNLFKCFLIVNEDINQLSISSGPRNYGDLRNISELLIAMLFSTGDIGMFKDDKEFAKAAYAAYYRFEKLIEFLRLQGDTYEYLVLALNKSFSSPSIDVLLHQAKYLIVSMAVLKSKGIYELVELRSAETAFLNSLVSNKIEIDTDFIKLRQYPICKIFDDRFTIIDPYFVIDKFTKSVRFMLKESFDVHNSLPPKDRTFFSFFNKRFSEEFLMQDVLKSIFSAKHFYKISSALNNEMPDFYARNHKDIFLFEIKDVLIPKGVKMSNSIDKILSFLENRFLLNQKSKAEGIGQIITHIKNMHLGNVAYDLPLQSDTGTKKGKPYRIYPVLLVSDRIFNIPGVNFILNEWFRQELKKLGSINFDVMDLTLIDFDTLIIHKEALSGGSTIFKETIEDYYKNSKQNTKGYGTNEYEIQNNTFKKVVRRLSPYSSLVDEKLSIENVVRNMFASAIMT